MSVVYPSIRFNEIDYLNKTGDEYIYDDPLSKDDIARKIIIKTASTTSSGIVSTTNQTFSGVKKFNNNIECDLEPSASNHITNKAYVDQLVSTNLSWQTAVISFHDFTILPNPLNKDDRYISLNTFDDFIKDNIYVYNGINFIETTPYEGFCCYVSSDISVKFSNQCIHYNGVDWVAFSGTINHDNLIGVHQNVNTIASPSFNNLILTSIDDSNTTSTGALIVDGGVAIKKNLRVASSIYSNEVVNSINGFNDTKAVSNLDTSGGLVSMNTALTNTKYHRFLYAGKNSSNCAMGRYYHIADGSLENYTNLSIGWGDHLRIYSEKIIIKQITESDTTTTGALIVDGGVAIKKNLRVASSIYSDNAINGVNIYGNRLFASTTNTTSSNLIELFAPSLAIGNTATFRIGHHFSSDNCWTIDYQKLGDGDNQGNNAMLGMYGGAKLNFSRTTLKYNSNNNSNSTSTGAFQLTGGMGIAQNLYVGGLVNCNTFTLNTCGTILENGLTNSPASGLCINRSGSVAPLSIKNYSTILLFDVKRSDNVPTGECDISVSGGTENNLNFTSFVKIKKDTDSNTTSTGALVVSGGIAVGKRITSKNITCVSSPVNDDDVVRKIDITGGTLASSTLHLTGEIGSLSPETGTLIVDGGAGIAEKLHVGGSCTAVGFSATDPTRTYWASFSSSNSCATFHSGHLKPIEFSTQISQLYAKNVSDANPANLWSGAIRTDGGITAAKRIVSTYATCLTAPVNDTDVVRLVDIGGFLTASTYTLSGLQLYESLSSPVIYTYAMQDIIIRRIYGVVTLYWRVGFGHTMQASNNNRALINNNAIPTLYQPNAMAYSLNTISVNTSFSVGKIFIDNGKIGFTKIDSNGFAYGDQLVIGGFTMSWMN